MAIRIMRLIEYVYADEERMADDMSRWTASHRDRSMTMRSAVLPPEHVTWSAPPARPGTVGR